MRILSGQFKNRELKTPKGDKTRPTSSKIRGSVFDILQNEIEEATFLDLFAGSGAMGIEALSRGAKEATFVERDRAAAGCIRENLVKLQIKAPVLQQDAAYAVKQLTKQNKTFSIIYVDPPYAIAIEPILETLSPLLTENGLLILEQSKKAKITSATLKQVDERNFGDTTLLFFRHPE